MNIDQLDWPSPASLESMCSITRREFLASCLALVASGAAAQTGEERDESDPDAVFLAIVHCLLPFEHPDFPDVTAEQIAERSTVLFPRSDSEEAGVRRALGLFNTLPAFVSRRAMRKPADTADEQWNTTVSAEQQLGLAFLQSCPDTSRTFTELDIEDRAAYLRLWARSHLVDRRRYYRSLKSLVMVTAYSMEVVWAAIQYDGPLVGRG